MSWTKTTDNRYHTQDGTNYCGAACAMMVLAEIGVDYAHLDQDVLYKYIHSRNAQRDWFIDPEALKRSLNELKPTTFPKNFSIYRETSEKDASHRILSILQQNGGSAIVLALNYVHWLVVCGVRTDVDPTTGPYTIEAFWVHNPEDERNEPHGAGDICGSRGHGPIQQWVSYRDWRKTFLIGHDYDDPAGKLQFIVIGTSDQAATALPVATDPPAIVVDNAILQTKAILDWLLKYLKLYELDTDPRTAQLASGTLGTPLLVQRLDDPASIYALVPFMQGNIVLGYGQVDAMSGNLESVYVMQDDATSFETDLAKVAKSLIGAEVKVPGKRTPYRLLARKFKVDPQLVWMPCRQSKSARLPFWRVVAGPYVFYRRIDGPLFAELTLDGKGG